MIEELVGYSVYPALTGSSRMYYMCCIREEGWYHEVFRPFSKLAEDGGRLFCNNKFL